jgi:hypothetical protein
MPPCPLAAPPKLTLPPKPVALLLLVPSLPSLPVPLLPASPLSPPVPLQKTLKRQPCNMG